MAPKVVTAEVRFWKYVDKDGPVPLARPELGKCWLWTGAKTDYSHAGGVSYGRFRGPNSKMVAPHRFSWEMKYGKSNLPATDHLCRVTLCVNPDHVEPVTDKENILRGKAPAASNALKTSCPKGHPYDTYIDGRRGCSKCRKENLARNVRDRKRRQKLNNG